MRSLVQKTFILLLFLSAKASYSQDTILFNDFQVIAIDSLSRIDVKATNSSNLQWQAWQIKSSESELSDNILLGANGTPGITTNPLYDADVVKNWHIWDYDLSIDTTVVADTLQLDVTTSWGIRSYSWFEVPQAAFNVLISPPIWLDDDKGILRWKSMPLQGPRHQDGYKVYILEGAENEPLNTPFLTLPYDFAVKSMDVTSSSPPQALSSLKELRDQWDFIPQDGAEHTRYTLPAPNQFNVVDSTRQTAFMQEFELSLSSYTGFIQIAFVHDSYDNNGMMLDDILVLGNGNAAVNKAVVAAPSLTIYPNPAQNVFYLKGANDFTKVEVYNLAGVLVKTFTVQAAYYDVANLSAGTYVVKAYSNTNIFTNQITILR